MSQSVPAFRHPFDIVRHPTMEPEVKRAILASWASDSAAVKDRPDLRRPPGVNQAIRIDDVIEALKSLDGHTLLRDHRS